MTYTEAELKAMTDNQLNDLVTQKIMEKIPCDEWTTMSFGAAGGMVLRKNCEHENCYPVATIGNVHGKIGGVPDYLHNWKLTMEVVARMQSLSYKLELWMMQRPRDNWARFGKGAAYGINVGDASPQRAICIAALLSGAGT